MAEERSPQPVESRADTPALEFQAGIGTFHIRIKIKSDLLAAGIVGAGFLALRAFYHANPREVKFAVKTALETWAAYVLSIRPSSILVEFVCNTEESYQAFMSAFAAGTVRQRLQEEFFKIGFKGELQVTIVEDDNAPQIREWNFPKSEAPAQTDFSEGSLSNPPDVNVVLLKPRDLPKRAVEWKDVHLPIDILLVTVKECEFYSCLSWLNLGYYKSYKPELGLLYLGEMGDAEAKIKVAVIQCNMGSTTVAPKAVRALRPKAVICVGFCAGLKEKKVKFGDVIISSKLATYAPTKGTGDEIIERGVQVPASPLLNGILKFADHGWEAPLKNPKDLEVKVHKDGLFLSGPEVVSSDERRKQIINKYPLAIGVEMEDEGLCATVDDLGIEWAVIKGVSHYAGNNKSENDCDSWRSFASLMAASVVAHVLSDGNLFQDWLNYEDKGS